MEERGINSLAILPLIVAGKAVGVFGLYSADTGFFDDDEMRLLELFQLQSREGPCLDCFSSREPVVNADLAGSSQWPRFAPAALASGFRMVHALPSSRQTRQPRWRHGSRPGRPPSGPGPGRRGGLTFTARPGSAAPRPSRLAWRAWP